MKLESIIFNPEYTYCKHIVDGEYYKLLQTMNETLLLLCDNDDRLIDYVYEESFKSSFEIVDIMVERNLIFINNL